MEDTEGFINAMELAMDYGIPISSEEYEKYKKIKEGTSCSINSESSIHTRN